MEAQNLRAIIFDLDGVLTATVEYHYHAWCKALEPHSIPFSRQDNEKIRSLTRRQSLEVILNGRQLPLQAQEEILQRKNAYYLDYIAHITQDDILPGVQEFLEAGRPQSMRFGVASSSSNARPVLQLLGLIDYMDAVVDANDVAVSKPAPDVYIRAAEALNVAPETCLAIDDSAAGIYSAARAGMCPVAVGKLACIHTAQACLSDLAGVTLENLQQIYASWVARVHPTAAYTAFWD